MSSKEKNRPGYARASLKIIIVSRARKMQRFLNITRGYLCDEKFWRKRRYIQRQEQQRFVRASSFPPKKLIFVSAAMTTFYLTKPLQMVTIAIIRYKVSGCQTIGQGKMVLTDTNLFIFFYTVTNNMAKKIIALLRTTMAAAASATTVVILYIGVQNQNFTLRK